jgi:acyl-CoA hydrolase
MEVFVKIIDENMTTGERNLCTTCFLTFVAINENSQPIPVPKVIPENEEEKLLYTSAEKRYLNRKTRRQETKKFTSKLTLTKPWE